jgi:hypothetical protein
VDAVRTDEEYKIGYERYEFVRKLKPHEFRSIWEGSLKGARFDDLVDLLRKTKERP